VSSRITAERPEPLEPPPSGETSRWLVLVIVCLAQFMVILDATVVNVALPSIQQDLGFSRADLQWVINGYTLVFAASCSSVDAWATWSGGGRSSSSAW
jgi:MFS family permease